MFLYNIFFAPGIRTTNYFDQRGVGEDVVVLRRVATGIIRGHSNKYMFLWLLSLANAT